MKIYEFLSPQSIIFLDAEDKDDLFEKVSKIVSTSINEVSQKEIISLIKEREKLASTYAGKNFAIPHIKCKKLENFFIFLFILEKEIVYDDEKKVRNIFFIAGPDKNYPLHLVILSRIARMLKETDIAENLKGKTDKDKILSLIKDAENKII